jgi:hypothetical protein
VDAIRFITVAREGKFINLRYILERAHAPCGQGTLVYDLEDQNLRGAEQSPLLEAQARAFAKHLVDIQPR